jgi:ubiquinone/menaquinone biosynthesis C-methylase UbiE
MPPRSETYLHGHHDSVLRSHRWRTAENSAGYLLDRLLPEARVLDVGCGPGTITADLAARVPSGEVVGIDAAVDVLSEARAEASRRELSNVRFETGDVYGLAFGDDSFDVVHAHQVLQHLSDPVAALGEMRRVCRPGWRGRRARRRLRRLLLVPVRSRTRRVAGAVPGRGPHAGR